MYSADYQPLNLQTCLYAEIKEEITKATFIDCILIYSNYSFIYPLPWHGRPRLPKQVIFEV